MTKFASITITTLFLICGMLSSATAGDITGKISFKGKVPASVKIKMNADPKCVRMHSGKDVVSEQVVVNSNNTLRWVFIYVKKGLEGKKFETPQKSVVLEQKGCMYSPHVFGMMVNQPINITNDDATLHNVHALAKNSAQFNIAQPKQGMKLTKTFTKSEVMVKVKCEVHNWMAAYIGVLDHPYYGVSDEKGQFEIKGLPAGEYEIEAWHEKYGAQTMKVKVDAAGAKTADFAFEAK